MNISVRFKQKNSYACSGDNVFETQFSERSVKQRFLN